MNLIQFFSNIWKFSSCGCNIFLVFMTCIVQIIKIKATIQIFYLASAKLFWKISDLKIWRKGCFVLFYYVYFKLFICFFKRLFDFIDSLLWLIFSLRSIFFLSLLLLFWCGFYVLVGSVVFQGFLGGSIVSCSSFCDTVCFCNVWYFSALVGSTFVSCFLSCVKGFPWLFFWCLLGFSGLFRVASALRCAFFLVLRLLYS